MNKPAKMILVAGAALGLLLVGYFQGYMHGVTGMMHDQMSGLLDQYTDVQKIRDRVSSIGKYLRVHQGHLNITVAEKPFGMHVRRGSLMVEEVFPGFPAEALGVHSGCAIRQIMGEPVKQGTWLEVFQKQRPPFSMSFFCTRPQIGFGPLSGDKHSLKVMVLRKPYGMNVQVNVVPRVIEVLPGSLAEAAGVKRGYVLTHVNNQAVDPENWYSLWHDAKLPSTLTLDTSVPIHKNNPFFDDTTGDWINWQTKDVTHDPANLPDEWADDDPIPGFEDVATTVKELPFGMQVYAVPGKLPIIKTVSGPAAVQGVKPGDVLLKIAGTRVDSSSWFAAFQKASPPFGLRFRRPERGAVHTKDFNELMNPVMPAVGELEITVHERAFGMSVLAGSVIVEEVFKGFPARRAGIHKGCEILEIAGESVSQGTWMEGFKKAALPFSLKLNCPRRAKQGPQGGPGPLAAHKHNFTAKLTKRPFGANIQGHVLPRVVEVLPGSAAEAEGVKAGFVLTHIDDMAVSVRSWFDIWQNSPIGTVLTFDTSIPLHENNPYVEGGYIGKRTATAPLLADDGSLVVPHELENGYHDYRVAVKKLPFGMQLSSPKIGRPTVVRIAAESPAEDAGIKAGDVLIGISGLPVDTDSWFVAFQQATPPFGLRFRRPSEPRSLLPQIEGRDRNIDSFN